jgi:hypothetical protein
MSNHQAPGSVSECDRDAGSLCLLNHVARALALAAHDQPQGKEPGACEKELSPYRSDPLAGPMEIP